MTLVEARQPGTDKIGDCTENRCIAGRAIDGIVDTFSKTTRTNNPWWRAKLTKTAKVYTILAYLHPNVLYEDFEVETALKYNDWKSCKRKYSVEGPVSPHVISCDTQKTANHIRLSRKVKNDYLFLYEVKVTRVSQGMYYHSSYYCYHHNHSPLHYVLFIICSKFALGTNEV